MFWQILFPMIVLSLVFLALAVWAALSAYGQVSLWADVAWIGLFFPWLIVLLLILAILVAAVAGMVLARKAVARWMLTARNGMDSLQRKTRAMSDQAVQPVIQMAGWQAALRRIFGKK